MGPQSGEVKCRLPGEEMPIADCRLPNEDVGAAMVGATPHARPTFSASFRRFASDIKLHHTVFALPFALLATFLASGGWPLPGKLLLILLCMVTARTVAMAANRLLDAKLDAQNPRTARRAIPSGAVSPAFFAAIVAVCCLAFILATGLFQFIYRNPWPLILSMPTLLFISAYPLLKRFTRLCHYYLGAALGLAPVCAWIAIRGDLSPTPLWLGLGVLLWTAGFDIIYACQDYAIDVQQSLHSVPSKMGIGRALWVSRFTHLASVAAFVFAGMSSPMLGILYFVGIGLAVVLLLVEHALVRANDLSKVNVAFFTINGMISLAVGTLGIIGIFLHR